MGARDHQARGRLRSRCMPRSRSRRASTQRCVACVSPVSGAPVKCTGRAEWHDTLKWLLETDFPRDPVSDCPRGETELCTRGMSAVPELPDDGPGFQAATEGWNCTNDPNYPNDTNTARPLSKAVQYSCHSPNSGNSAVPLSVAAGGTLTASDTSTGCSRT